MTLWQRFKFRAKELAINWLARLREAFPVNRVVAILTPIVFVPAAGFITTWLAKNAPGLPALDSTELTGLFILGGGAALTAAYKWMSGWHAYEKNITAAAVKSVATGVPPEGHDIDESDFEVDVPEPSRQVGGVAGGEVPTYDGAD